MNACWNWPVKWAELEKTAAPPEVKATLTGNWSGTNTGANNRWLFFNQMCKHHLWMVGWIIRDLRVPGAALWELSEKHEHCAKVSEGPRVPGESLCSFVQFCLRSEWFCAVLQARFKRTEWKYSCTVKHPSCPCSKRSEAMKTLFWPGLQVNFSLWISVPSFLKSDGLSKRNTQSLQELWTYYEFIFSHNNPLRKEAWIPFCRGGSWDSETVICLRSHSTEAT